MQAHDFPLAINEAFKVMSGQVDEAKVSVKRRLSKKEGVCVYPPPSPLTLIPIGPLAFEAAVEQRVDTLTRPTDRTD